MASQLLNIILELKNAAAKLLPCACAQYIHYYVEGARKGVVVTIQISYQVSIFETMVL